MKVTVKSACGHSNTQQFFGPMKERDRKIEWIANPHRNRETSQLGNAGSAVR